MMEMMENWPFEHGDGEHAFLKGKFHADSMCASLYALASSLVCV